MKRLIFPALLLLSPLAHATLYKWEGSVDFGAAPQTAFGSFNYSPKLGMNKLSLLVGAQQYSAPTGPQGHTILTNGQFSMTDIPLIIEGNDHEGGDFFFDQGSKFWSFQWFKPNSDPTETGGTITRFFADANPTPEPSTFVFAAFAALAFLGIKVGRSAVQRRL